MADLAKRVQVFSTQVASDNLDSVTIEGTVGASATVTVRHGFGIVPATTLVMEGPVFIVSGSVSPAELKVTNLTGSDSGFKLKVIR